MSLNNDKAEKLYNIELTKIIKKMGKNTTDNFQLDKVGKQLFGNKYIGTFSSDNIPTMRQGQYCIVNTDPSNMPGEHWVGLARMSKKILFYDSFGRTSKSLMPSLLQTNMNTDLDAEQDILEKSCGQRCIGLLTIFDKHGWKLI